MHPLFRRVRNLAALAVIAVLGTGCLLGGRSDPVQVYAPVVTIQAQPDWPEVDWQLLLVRPSADQMHDSQRILVRPEPARLQVYRGASWADSMPEMLHSILIRAFEDSGKIGAVSRQSTNMRARFILSLDVRAFEAVYDGEATPLVDLQIHAKLIHTPTTRVVSSHSFRQQVRASQTATGSVVAAFQEAIGAFTTELVGWTLREGESAGPVIAEWREQRAREREEERRVRDER